MSQMTRRDLFKHAAGAAIAVTAVSPWASRWPEWRSYAIENVGYDMYSRVVFQSKSAFWEQDGVSPNWVWASSYLSQLWRVAEEVATPRAALVATAVTGADAAISLGTFRKL